MALEKPRRTRSLLRSERRTDDLSPRWRIFPLHPDGTRKLAGLDDAKPLWASERQLWREYRKNVPKRERSDDVDVMIDWMRARMKIDLERLPMPEQEVRDVH